MQGLRAKTRSTKGCALADRRAFLAGDAAADTNDQVRVFLFEGLPAAKLVEHFFLGFLANRTGIKQDDVGVFFVLGRLQAMAVHEQILHARRVVLIHLTAMCFDEYFFHQVLRSLPRPSAGARFRGRRSIASTVGAAQ
jgi:hypothetical protein